MSSRGVKIRRWVASLNLYVLEFVCVLSPGEFRVRFPVYVEGAQFSSLFLSPYDPREAGTLGSNWCTSLTIGVDNWGRN